MSPTDAMPSAVTDTPGLEPVQSTAETAECTCPEFCERDHDLD